MAVTQSHFRFGINELAENTHGWHAAEDTNPTQGTIAVDTTFLLRFCLQCDATAQNNIDPEFQYRKNGGAWTNITTTSDVVRAVTTTVFTNGQNTTKRLSGTGTFEASSAGCTHDGVSGGAAFDIVASGNGETECSMQIRGVDVIHGDVIEFRLTRDGGVLLDTYAVTPSYTVSEAWSLDIEPVTTVPVRRRFAAAAALAMATAFVDVPAAAAAQVTTAAGDGGLVPGRHLVQYQAVTGPVLVPAVASLPDQWWPVYPDSVAAPRIAQVGEQVWEPFTPAEIPPVPDQWGPVYPEPLPVPTAPVEQFLAWHSETPAPPPLVPDLTPPVYPDRTTRRTLPPAGQQALAWQPQTPAAAPAVISNAAGDSGVVFPTRLTQYQGTAGPVLAIPEVPPPVPDLVDVTYPDLLPSPHSAANLSWGQQHFGVEIQVPVQSWLPAYPDHAPGRLRAIALRLGFAAPVDPPPAPPPPDLWTVIAPDRVPAKARACEFPEPVAPLYVPDVTVVAPPLSWEPTFADRVLPKRGLASALQYVLGWHTDTPPPPEPQPNTARRSRRGGAGGRIYRALRGIRSYIAPED